MTKGGCGRSVCNRMIPHESGDRMGKMGDSARGSLSRSEFGMAYGIPAPGTAMGDGRVQTASMALYRQYKYPQTIRSISKRQFTGGKFAGVCGK